jgi:hypothetical protein
MQKWMVVHPFYRNFGNLGVKFEKYESELGTFVGILNVK